MAAYCNVLVLMGPRGSGKSAVGHALACRLAWPYLSFGSYIRQQAIARNTGLEGILLEELGSQLIEECGHDGLLADLLKAQGGDDADVILDGVRHPKMLRAVKQLYARTTSIYIVVSEMVRYERWLRREGIQNSTNALRAFQLLSGAHVERHVFGLCSMADHTVDGSLPLEELVSEVGALVK
jgi:cytidylate kinase